MSDAYHDRPEMIPTGLYREPDGWVLVDYAKTLIPIPRERYELSGYEPSYDQLPTKDDYERTHGQSPGDG